jgi:hypothetical protein
VISEESEILYNILFLLSIPYTEPDYFLSHVRIIDKEYLLRSVFAFGEPISIDHGMVYIWIYLTDTGNRVLIQVRLDICSYSVFHELLLICELTRTISFSDIVLEYICSTRQVFLLSFMASNETKQTLFTFQLRTSALIFSILFQPKRTTFRAFFLS